MLLKDLEIFLSKKGVPEDAYSLSGGLPNEAYCIDHTDEGWVVYYSERGIRSSLQSFESESEACEYFAKWVEV